MGLSEIINIVLGGGFLAALAGLATLKSTVRKAAAEAEKARAEAEHSEADAESLRIDNAEHATRILMENIVKPLKDEFNETKKELARNTREMARLRKAIDGANGCDYRSACPVLHRLREHPKDNTGSDPDGNGPEQGGQHEDRSPPGTDGDGAEVGGETGDTG